MNENEKRDSDSAVPFREQVIIQLANINGRFAQLATRDDIASIRLEISELKADMNQRVHDVASAKVKTEMEKRHELCTLEFQALARKERTEHEAEFHKRTSSAPDADVKKIKAVASAILPIVIKYVLPLVAIGGGGIYAGQQIEKKEIVVQKYDEKHLTNENK